MTTQEFNKSIESLGDAYEAAKDAVHQSMNPSGSEMSTVLNALGQFRDLAATALQKAHHNATTVHPSPAIGLISRERIEQIEKHGFDHQYTKDHPEYYSDKQLNPAARELLNQHPGIMGFPESWDNRAMIHKMASKSYIERLIIAGALIAAEIDRLYFNEKL